jgi:hypothetical protein
LGGEAMMVACGSKEAGGVSVTSGVPSLGQKLKASSVYVLSQLGQRFIFALRFQVGGAPRNILRALPGLNQLKLAEEV